MGPATAYRQPSFGTFSTNLEPVYRFGVPQQVNMRGLFVDMDVVAQSLKADDNDAQVGKAVGQQLGMLMSALEHQIPEQFFTNEDNPGEAVSAVKALNIAAQQGQKIFQVTQENLNLVLPQLNIGQGVKDEIVASVAVGKEVTVSQNNISVAGWTGVGYIVSDPNTGAGAYRISGGGNGAVLTSGSLILLIALYGALVVPVLGVFLLAFAAVLISFKISLVAYIDDDFLFDVSLFKWVVNFSLWAIGGTAKGATLLVSWLIAGIFGFTFPAHF